MPNLTPLDRLRLDRGAEHLIQLGPRALAEFLLELDSIVGGMPATLRLMAQYQAWLSPALLHTAGGHRFPTRRPRAVPTDLRRPSP